MKRLLLSVLLLAVVSGCFRGALRSDVRPPLPDYWPTKEWRSSAPEAQGADAALLADAVEFVVKEGIDAHALLIVRHGYVILDAAFYPAAPGAVHDQASTTKSIVSTLVGIAIDKGSIISVRQPVLSLFRDRRVDNLDDDKRAMTVDDVLTMRSGLTCIWSNLAGPMTDLIRSPDWVQYILDRPMVAEPGTRWCYSNSDSHLLSGIVRAATGVPAVDYAKEHLFGPLGITDVVWPADPQGNNIGYAELRIAPRDMAKFGLLFLHRGLWDGRQIVSEGWVEEAVKARHELLTLPGDPFDGYGRQWWSSSWGFYTTRGRGGQFIAVFPSLDAVVVMTAAIGDEAQMRKVGKMLTGMILPALGSPAPLPANADGVARLERSVKAAAQAPRAAIAAPPLPATAMKVSGRTYAIDPNPIDLTTFQVSFEEGAPEARAVLTLAGGVTLDLPVGLDGAYRFGKGRFGFPAAMKGAWKGDGAFEATLDEIGNNARWTITAAFEGEIVTLKARGAGIGEVWLVGRERR